ncbi:isopropylmalate isomerase [Marinobacter sp.]|uniref:isopropylmalate isomerase n=1 Tax=Marinobacter sp. TaxID=50741 RepID=UPI003B52D125
MFSERWIPVSLSLMLVACGSLPSQSETGSNREAFLDVLAAESEACGRYRDLYVQGFETNVAALSESDSSLKARAETLLKQSTYVLNEAGIEQQDCSRPYCIIKPLQNGRLESWCGYRIAADQGEELYQWLNWSEASNSAYSP